MWILYAAGSSFFAGITAILAKCGIKKTDSERWQQELHGYVITGWISKCRCARSINLVFLLLLYFQGSYLERG